MSSSSSSSSTLSDLHSHLSLPVPPYWEWEQCLHLKTGEVYYINSKTGMKVKKDPRSWLSQEQKQEQDLLYSESDESSSDEFASSTTTTTSTNYTNRSSNKKENLEEMVLVVAGCKRCLMYFMVPKKLQDCPKCTTHLLHFHNPFP